MPQCQDMAPPDGSRPKFPWSSFKSSVWVSTDDALGHTSFIRALVGAERDTSPQAVVEHCKLKLAHTLLLSIIHEASCSDHI